MRLDKYSKFLGLPIVSNPVKLLVTSVIIYLPIRTMVIQNYRSTYSNRIRRVLSISRVGTLYINIFTPKTEV